VKVGDLVRIKADQTNRFPQEDWCKWRLPCLVVKSCGSIIAMAQNSQRFMPAVYFEVLNEV
jgi:hypothetical protein